MINKLKYAQETLFDDEITKFEHLAYKIRTSIIESIYHAQTGHLGPSLSMVEILVMLYFKYLNVDPQNPHDLNRDYMILSKGHGAPGYYATLAHAGFMEIEELLTLRKMGSRLQGHPNANYLPGVDACTGSLGQGLSIGVGLSLGFKHQNRLNRVFCILGDGELQEGQNWEAAMSSAAFGLNRLTIIIDRNQIQNDGPTESIIPLESLKQKWEAFGLRAIEIDGHDWQQIDQALDEAMHEEARPTVVIARTIKGKGVSFMENTVKWHHHPLTEQERIEALNEIEKRYKS